MEDPSDTPDDACQPLDEIVGLATNVRRLDEFGLSARNRKVCVLIRYKYKIYLMAKTETLCTEELHVVIRRELCMDLCFTN